ncbi:MAG: LPXTG cell wall anchor domain-containing protein [Actinobacteria bacterium]|nr:LPXTG cell wall anchor domain-containing protein [Actinomycetota bacterium]
MTSGSNRSRQRRLTAAALTTTAVVGASLFGVIPAANAVADSFVVSNLNLTGAGSLQQAIIDANASVNPDGVEITFDPALAGTGQIQLTPGAGNVNVMNTTTLNHGEQTQGGAWFEVSSTVPVSIDFTNLDGIEAGDQPYAGIYVNSDGVTLSNLSNLRVGEAGIAVAGTGTTIENVELKDSNTNYQETGVLLMDGATETYIDDVTVHSAYWGSIVVDTDATVTGTEITNLVSRGVENWGHFVFEDNSVVSDFWVDGATLGALDEVSPTHGFFINPNVETTELGFVNSLFQSPGREGFHFFGGGQTLTDTVIGASQFKGTEAKKLGRVIGDNSADFDGLLIDDSEVDFAGGAVIGGTLSDANITNNSFTNIFDGGAAALQLRDATDVTVAGNVFDLNWTLDHIRVEGTAANNVAIVNNQLHNLNASVSRSAVRIQAPGADNVVDGNTMTQNNSAAGARADSFNHWAVYNSANAASRDAYVGWSITDNAIDGFGWNYLANAEGGSQAPIVHAGVGKLPVTGNTFGEHTRGSVAADVEHHAYWFFWNAGDANSNNGVQTFRAEDVAFDSAAETVSFTAVQPANQPANTTATTPVTLHVYWTASNHAEVYLGAISDVAPGDTVSIGAPGHADGSGFVRLQTVDANGNTSQYSSIDPDAPSAVPAAPVVKTVRDTGVSGTGTPGGTFAIYDENGEVVDSGEIDGEGNWVANSGKLVCNTEYTVTQTVGGVESNPTEFKTLACNSGNANANGGTANANGSGTAAGNGTQLPNTGGDNITSIALGGAALLLLVGGALLVARRRSAGKA